VGLAWGDVGDQRTLVVRALVDVDAQLLAQAGAAAIGQHGQIAFDLGFVIEGQAITVAKGLHRRDFRRAAPAHYISVEALPQALAKPGVLHHVAQGWNAFFQRVETGSAEATAVRHLDLADRLGTAADALPQAQALVDLPGAEGQRRRACVIAGLETVAGGEGLYQQDLPAPGPGTGLQGQGETGANQAAADDGEMDPAHATWLLAAAIRASISATVLGTPEVRISQPFLVTTTSSSIRTPIPRHFFATLWLSAAI
jgi:hypothetical protein